MLVSRNCVRSICLRDRVQGLIEPVVQGWVCDGKKCNGIEMYGNVSNFIFILDWMKQKEIFIFLLKLLITTSISGAHFSVSFASIISNVKHSSWVVEGKINSVFKIHSMMLNAHEYTRKFRLITHSPPCVCVCLCLSHLSIELLMLIYSAKSGSWESSDLQEVINEVVTSENTVAHVPSCDSI